MRTTLTHSQMLRIWRLAKAVEPSRLDCSATRDDGIDIDVLMATEMRSWYLDLLDHGPLSALAPEQMADEAQVTSTSDSPLLTITPPEGTRRVLSIGFDGWDAPIAPTATPEDVMLTAANPFCCRPVAAVLPSGEIIAAPARPPLTDLTVTFDYGTDTYLLDDSALPTLDQLAINN